MSNYWSATTNANNTNNAWCVNFNNGNDNNNNKSNSRYVRGVRSGKCPLLSFESVHDAYMDCRKRKRGTINALRFEYDLIGNLTQLALELQKGTYRPSRSVCFVTNTPKLREIFAADFRDRVVHHLVVRELEKIWEPCFIYDSYACRTDRGTHKAVSRLQNFMLKVSRNQKRAACFMQLDIRSFFMSIDKQILFGLLKKKVKSDTLLYLSSVIIFHDCTQDYIFKGNPSLPDNIPPHKSLFKTGPRKGLPIGNLTSQFFANVYLNELDQFVKHELKCRFYVRYVDDFILLDPCEERLSEWKSRTEQFLHDKLELRLKDEGTMRRTSEGADFLGYIVRPTHILSRNRVVNNLKYRLALFREKLVQTFQYRRRVIRKMSLPPETVTELRQVLSSYLGHFKHADSHHLVQSLFEKHSWLNDIFLLWNGRLVERFRYKGTFSSFRLQVRFFSSEFQDHILLFHVGKYVEVFEDDALLLNRIYGFNVKTGFRKMKHAVGLPIRMKKWFIRKTLFLGHNIVLIEEGDMGRYIRDRYVSEIYLIIGHNHPD